MTQEKNEEYPAIRILSIKEGKSTIYGRLSIPNLNKHSSSVIDYCDENDTIFGELRLTENHVTEGGMKRLVEVQSPVVKYDTLLITPKGLELNYTIELHKIESLDQSVDKQLFIKLFNESQYSFRFRCFKGENKYKLIAIDIAPSYYPYT